MKNKVILESFKVIGITVRTTNENGQAGIDIPKLWNKFMSESVLTKIPNKITEEIYSIYTEYESDHTKPYTTILGCKVSSLATIPDGMTGFTFQGGNYKKFIAKGDLTQGAVYQEWSKIWNLDLKRTYTADFEIYGEKAQDQQNAEVDIFIALDS
ncbi:MAG TPA: AraC family transcriptional regulator [Crocinitomix sp.]|nr:AraC family transcriptional regulator [Crocinitomix sp.]